MRGDGRSMPSLQAKNCSIADGWPVGLGFQDTRSDRGPSLWLHQDGMQDGEMNGCQVMAGL